MSLMARLHEPVYERRLAVLAGLVAAELKPGEKVLDVGCGNGRLAAAIGDHPDCPEGVSIEGCEKSVRGGEAVPVFSFDGYRLDAPDGAWDVTILADVVHHEEQPERLLAEVARVTRRAVVIKDHKADGPLAHPRICLMDWAANKPYGIPCLYRYFSPAQWREQLAPLGLEPVREIHSIDLYPPGWNLVFGRRLQYLAVAERPETGTP